MKITYWIVPIWALALAFSPAKSWAEDLGATTLDDARVEVYKTVGEIKLNAYIYAPTTESDALLPAIVFFFGGGWRGGDANQFAPHCRYLQTRGMVAITLDYRVSSRQDVKAIDCVRDAKSAIRWVRANAERLHIDPKKIAAGGGSAGGHLAACTALLDEFDEASEDLTVSSKPNALVLFNPAVVLASIDTVDFDETRIDGLRERLGVEPESLSPAHHIEKAAPPAIVFHGTADETVPFETVETFERLMNEAGNPCTLIPYEGRGHGFFNLKRGPEDFASTVEEMDKFLATLGWLEGEPAIREMVGGTTTPADN